MLQKYSIILGLIVLFAMMACTPAALSTAPNSKEVVWDAEAYSSLENQWDSIVATTGIDTLSYKSVRVLKNLFAGSIDRRNPTPDYDKSFEYARILSGIYHSKENQYENWYVVLEWVVNEDDVARKLQKKLSRARLENRQTNKKNSQHTDELLRLKKEVKYLTEELATQEETIEKLRKLEVLMEKERGSY